MSRVFSTLMCPSIPSTLVHTSSSSNAPFLLTSSSTFLTRLTAGRYTVQVNIDPRRHPQVSSIFTIYSSSTSFYDLKP